MVFKERIKQGRGRGRGGCRIRPTVRKIRMVGVPSYEAFPPENGVCLNQGLKLKLHSQMEHALVSYDGELE
ncbi:hypothetical protein V6N13_064553 [Hibiscus sabdariffa]|uniref:Uncharacterized protein n=1 Tax=Hibiscus sabdariffa TaxID=183260 RepID=A0ABR2EAE5_9ROSI